MTEDLTMTFDDTVQSTSDPLAGIVGLAPSGDDRYRASMDDPTPPFGWAKLAENVATRIAGARALTVPDREMPRIPSSVKDMTDTEVGETMTLMTAWDVWLRQAAELVAIEVAYAEKVVDRTRARFFKQWNGPVTQGEKVVDADEGVIAAEQRMLGIRSVQRLLETQRAAYSKSAANLSRIIAQRESDAERQLRAGKFEP